jgi:diguanylate cyclase (GGDEF)-like protein
MAAAEDGSRRYAASTGDAVRPAAVGLAVAYLLVALPPAFLLPAPQARVLAPTMAAGAAASALIGWSTSLVRRELGEVVHWFLAGLAGVPTVTSLMSLVVLAQPFHTVNLMLTLVAATALIHVRRAAVAVALVVVLAWLVAGLAFVPVVVTADTVSGMAMACVVAVILHVSRQRTVARLETARGEIATMAVTDVLTGVGNRRALMERGPAVLAAARAAGRDVTLLYLDLDGLKRVNDGEGHAAGDKLIASVGTALRSVFRDADIVARCGGDEFAVLVTARGPDQTEALIDRLREALASVDASASIGTAHLAGSGDLRRSGALPAHPPTGSPAADLEALLDEADRQMYRAKRARPVAVAR